MSLRLAGSTIVNSRSAWVTSLNYTLAQAYTALGDFSGCPQHKCGDLAPCILNPRRTCSVDE